MRKDQQNRLSLLQQGFEPEQAVHLDFLRWVRRRKPKKSLSKRKASQSGVDLWNQLPKAKVEKPARGYRNVQPGPGSGML